MGSLPSIWEVWPYMGSPPIHETAFYMWAVFPHIGSIPMYEKPSCVWEAIPYMGRLPILGTHVVMVASGADLKEVWTDVLGIVPKTVEHIDFIPVVCCFPRSGSIWAQYL